MSEMKSNHFKIPWWAAILLLAVCVMGIAGHDLWTPDEPRDVCVSYTVVTSGDWVVPRLAGEPFMEKPPLFFIVCGLMGMWLSPLLGFVGGARMVVALCALMGATATWWIRETRCRNIWQAR